MSNEIVKYESDNGQEITVTEQDVRDLIAASGSNVNNVSPQEIKTFMRLCQAQRLNPFTKDAYLVKYGNSPATIIAGKETFTKRAQRNPKFQGYTAGITVSRGGNVERREGSMFLEGETLLGGWCAVSIDGYQKPMFDEVSFMEYNAPDKYGKNGWSKMPATMIRKVAICHALREAFPEDLGGLYGAEEMDQANNRQNAPQTDNAVQVDSFEVPEAADPRKQLWRDVSMLKAEYLSLGGCEDDVLDWMHSTILDAAGNPIESKYFTPDQIEALKNHLGEEVSIMQAEKEELFAGQEEAIEAEVVDYSDHDIDF